MADVKLTADATAVVKELQRVEAQLTQLNAKFADMAARAQAAANKTTQSMSGLTASVGRLNAAFSLTAIVAAMTTIANFGDGVIDLKNKLSQLNDTEAGVEGNFKGLVEIANRSRAPLKEVGDLYFRIARASDQLGISQQEAADITESISKAMTASGISAKEAAGPLLQIGQALQSGRFQGDELRSVMEGMPVVSKALARELGVSIGEVKKLGSEGKITGDVFVRAMKASKAEIDATFGRTETTVGQSFNVLINNLSLLFSEFDKASGFTKSLAQGIESISAGVKTLTENVDSLVTALKVLSAVLATIAVYRGWALMSAALAGVVVRAKSATTVVETVVSAASKMTAFKSVEATLSRLGTVLATIGRSLAFLASNTVYGKIVIGMVMLSGILYKLTGGFDDFIKRVLTGQGNLSEFEKILSKLAAPLRFMTDLILKAIVATQDFIKTTGELTGLDSVVRAIGDAFSYVRDKISQADEAIYKFFAHKNKSGLFERDIDKAKEWAKVLEEEYRGEQENFNKRADASKKLAMQQAATARIAQEMSLQQNIALKDYERNNKLAQEDIKFRTSQLGIADEYRRTAQAVYDIQRTGADKIYELERKRAELQAKVSAMPKQQQSDLNIAEVQQLMAMNGVIATAKKKITEETQRQVAAVTELLAAERDVTRFLERQAEVEEYLTKQGEALSQAYNSQVKPLIDQTRQLQDQVGLQELLIGRSEAEQGYLTAMAEMTAKRRDFIREINSDSSITVEAAKSLTEQYDQQLAAQQRLLETQRDNRIAQEALKLQRDQVAPIMDATAQLQKKFELEMQMRGLTERQRELARELLDIELKRVEAVNALGRDTSIDPANRIQAIEAITEAYREQARVVEEQMRATQEYQRSFGAGWQEAWMSYMESATNAANVAKNIFQSMANSMESAIDKFVETGKFSFSDFAKSVIKDIMKIVMKMMILRTLQTMFPGMGSIMGFANGGTPPMNRPSIVGERGPELFVPRSAGTIIPNDQLGGGGGVVNNYYTTNYNNSVSAVDAKSVAQLFAENRRALFGSVEQAKRELPQPRR
jgi:lambda family phage tail tape measure protein